jgi:putative phosphoesterase
MLTLGVIADTHVPDRARNLHPRILPLFAEAGVTAILHAGDVSTRRVLDELGTVAPVHAVRGNRDWVALRHLPMSQELNFEGVRVGLIHGHGRLIEYVVDRVDYIARGYRLEMFRPRVLAAFPGARVIVFGHTHRPLNLDSDGVLLFNPGSPHFPDLKTAAPSVGLLHIQAGGDVKGEIIPLY